MSADVVLFGLRAMFAVLLYGFLILLAFLVWRDLRSRRTETGVDTAAGAALKVVDGARSGLKRGLRLPLQDENLIGRSGNCAVALPDDTVSSRHAMLRRQDGRWWVEDLGSTNGTRVNGRPVNSRAVVVIGDHIEFGGVRVQLERVA